jgi:hypothetical protein
LARVQPGNATVACATDACAKAMGSIATALKQKGWRVTTVEHGGVGIDGVQGLRVESCNERAQQVVDALAPLFRGEKLDLEGVGPCRAGPTFPVIVVVGATP